jgi:hypothetical protein
MGKVIISENVSLDGVIEDPAGDEGFTRGGWVGRVGDRGREEAAGGQRRWWSWRDGFSRALLEPPRPHGSVLNCSQLGAFCTP